jgi:hypothetical protein
MDWLPLPLPPQVKVIMTTSSTDLSFKSLSKRRDTDVIKLPLFKERPHRLKLVHEFMMNMYSKHLPKRAFKAIVDCKHANRPLYLHTLAGEFRLYHVYTLIEHYLETYLEVSSLRDLWAKIIQRWITEYSWTCEPRTETAPPMTQQPEFGKYHLCKYSELNNLSVTIYSQRLSCSPRYHFITSAGNSVSYSSCRSS